MKKNKLYLILAIITSLLLFTTAAVCNQCQAQTEEETVAEETEEAIEEEALEEEEEVTEAEELEAPTIELQIYEGPVYSQADNVCYYRVKAIVTGYPHSRCRVLQR